MNTFFFSRTDVIALTTYNNLYSIFVALLLALLVNLFPWLGSTKIDYRMNLFFETQLSKKQKAEETNTSKTMSRGSN